MARYQTPQFVEHEAKIIGPLSFRQAAFVGGPLPVVLLLYFILSSNLILFVAIAILVEGIGVMLAFVKVEGKSVPQLIMHMLFFGLKPKMYVWKRGKTTLHFKEMEYVAPEGQTEEVQKADLRRKSRVQSLAVRVQTKR